MLSNSEGLFQLRTPLWGQLRPEVLPLPQPVSALSLPLGRAHRPLIMISCMLNSFAFCSGLAVGGKKRSQGQEEQTQQGQCPCHPGERRLAPATPAHLLTLLEDRAEASGAEQVTEPADPEPGRPIWITSQQLGIVSHPNQLIGVARLEGQRLDPRGSPRKISCLPLCSRGKLTSPN